MPRTYECTLLSLVVPTGSETHGFSRKQPIVSYDDERVRTALKTFGFTPTAVQVGDGTYHAYADVYHCDRDHVKLGMLLPGRFEPAKRLFALALARDIVARCCRVKCTAFAICCRPDGVRCVRIPVEYLETAKRMVATEG